MIMDAIGGREDAGQWGGGKRISEETQKGGAKASSLQGNVNGTCRASC